MRCRNSLPERNLEEVDDLCAQAAGDATMAVLAKLGDFRGEARFTTWACKFVILEVSTRLRRHAWRHRRVDTDESVWERLPDDARSALESIQDQEVIGVLDRAIREELTGARRPAQAPPGARRRGIRREGLVSQSPIDRLLGSDKRDPGCDAGLDVIDRYCEAVLRGEDAAGRFPDFATHIHNCTACREDTEALLAALRELEQTGR